MMYFVFGFLAGVVVCGILAKGYVMTMVAKERAALSAQYDSLKASIDARVAAVRKTAAEKVAGK